MSRLKGLLEFFPQLETLSIDNIMLWLGSHGDATLLENRLGNRILYPQTIPISVSDLVFDFALLREALKLEPQKYYSQNLKRIYIPQLFLDRFPDMSKLIWAFVDTFKPPGLTAIVEKIDDVGTKNLGTYIKPEVINKEGWIYLWIGAKKYQVKVGSLMIIPAPSNRVDIKLESASVLFLGKKELSSEVFGGQFGLMIDARC